MECRIYNTSLDPVGLIQSYISLDWVEQYNDVGSFTLELHRTAGILEIIKPDNYVGIAESTTLMVVKSVVLREGRVTATGFTALRVLADRITSAAITGGTNAETAMRTAVSGMTAFPRVALGTQAHLTDTYGGEDIPRGPVLDAVIKIAQATETGITMRHDKASKRLLFECFKPTEAALRCLPEYGNIGDAEYKLSNVDYKNVAIVVGATSTVTAGDTSATGAARREIIVDKSSETKQSSETTAQYQARLRAFGTEELAKYAAVDSLSATITDPAAQLGAIAYCRFGDLGLAANARIVGVEYISQNNKAERIFTLGKPVIIRRR